MNFKSLFLVILLFLISYVSIDVVPTFAQQLTIPNITPYWIKRTAYTTAEGLVLSKPKGSSSQDSSLFSSKNLFTTIPSAAGGLGILAGSLLTWWKVQGKRKAFKEYMKQIEVALEPLRENKEKGSANTKTLVNRVKESLTNLQTEIDLATANKKIDEDQRTTLEHTITRKLNELT